MGKGARGTGHCLCQFQKSHHGRPQSATSLAPRAACPCCKLLLFCTRFPTLCPRDGRRHPHVRLQSLEGACTPVISPCPHASWPSPCTDWQMWMAVCDCVWGLRPRDLRRYPIWLGVSPSSAWTSLASCCCGSLTEDQPARPPSAAPGHERSANLAAGFLATLCAAVTLQLPGGPREPPSSPTPTHSQVWGTTDQTGNPGKQTRERTRKRSRKRRRRKEPKDLTSSHHPPVEDACLSRASVNTS